MFDAFHHFTCAVCCSDLSPDNLKYLSSEQALADLAYFRLYMSDKLQLSGNKWIAFGGSYPGLCSCSSTIFYNNNNNNNNNNNFVMHQS